MSVELIESWFRSWLKRQPPRRRFKAQDGCACPVAEYLKERGAPKPYVGNGRVLLDMERDSYVAVAIAVANGRAGRPMPPWAKTFVENLDSCNFEDDHVSPAECLGVMDGVLPTKTGSKG